MQSSGFSAPAQSSLNSRHDLECVKKRGLSPEWIEVNCRSVSADEASDLLGYKAYSNGIWLEGANFQGQFKPDKPWESVNSKTEKKTKPKYRSAQGEYDIMLPKHPDDPDYWDDLEAVKAECYIVDGHPCVVSAEGFFKAIAGCSNEIPTIALLGVEMGLTPASADPQGKRYLVPGLERLARAGIGLIHAFDADSATNKNVIMAQLKLAHQLKKFNIPQYSVTGLWSIEQGKGMDDYIQNNGADSFRREILAKAVNIEAWEKQFQKHEEQGKKQRSPSARKVAHILAESYRRTWKYDLERQTWRRCNGKIWQSIHDEVFTQTVYREIEAQPDVDYDTFSYVENVVKFLKAELLEKEWNAFNRMEWIAFNDCVYEVKTGKTHEHSPGFMFTSVLEHNFPRLTAIDPNSTLLDQLRVKAPTFYSWAMYSQKGDPVKVLKLVAIINGVLKFRFFDLQMFVHLCGVPGAGKGTFARLLESVIGKNNHRSAKLHKLGEDNVIAAIIDSQLVICPDEKKLPGDISGLLSLTGGDGIPYRPIYKPQANGKFYGAIVILSNSAIFVGDTTGIDRRLCLVTFDVPLQERDTSIEMKMQEEVSYLSAIALSMPDSQVTDLIRGTGDAVIPDFKRQKWLHKAENDSVALFMEEHVASSSADSYVVLGNKNSNTHTLYGAYAQLCEENNSKTLFTVNNFRNHLLELCRELSWTDVREARQRDNQYRIYGVRLRSPAENAPRISELLGECVRVCTPCVSSVYTPEPLENKGCVECVDSLPHLSHEVIEQNFENKHEKSEQSFEKTNQNFSTSQSDDDPSKNPTHIHTPCSEPISDVTHTSTHPYTQLHTSTHTPNNSLKNAPSQTPTHTPTDSPTHTPTNPATQPELIIGVGRYADYCGERVKIVGFKGRGREVQVESVTGQCRYVKKGNLKPWIATAAQE